MSMFTEKKSSPNSPSSFIWHFSMYILLDILQYFSAIYSFLQGSQHSVFEWVAGTVDTVSKEALQYCVR